jgi:pyruvate ferredoxin oxidoreductase gamma subunit
MMAAKMTEIRWHGRGGQGAKTAAVFVAEAVLDQGMHSQGFPEYGPERRGAPVRGYTRISDKPIRLHCAIAKPDFVIVLDPTLMESATAGVTDGVTDKTIFLINTMEGPVAARKRLGIKEGTIYTVDASLIAQESFGRAIPNMPMVGALAKVGDVLTLEELTSAMAVRFKKKFSQAVVDGNITGVERAYEELVNE